jgi:hypothetical protein
LWHVKEPFIWCGTRQMMAKFFGHFSPIIPSFTNRGLSCRLAWSASGDDGRNYKGGAQRACSL